ncbi:hypothetical protein ACMD2_23235 [Ananas comosus]|uniref:Uncharacterized protein n=1 Tax=Ananas comosus TaxID=4615 RepID=A0A199VSF8_ANACO|nr:hypothetical protein ACMD2_23235 [Ananas comosus]
MTVAAEVAARPITMAAAAVPEQVPVSVAATAAVLSQTTEPSTSVSTRWPSCPKVSLEPRPFTGKSRFAAQTAVLSAEPANQMAKQ